MPVHRQVDCEFHAHGEYGWKVQFFIDREFSRSRRFETRGLAVRWPDCERVARDQEPELRRVGAANER